MTETNNEKNYIQFQDIQDNFQDIQNNFKPYVDDIIKTIVSTANGYISHGFKVDNSYKGPGVRLTRIGDVNFKEIIIITKNSRYTINAWLDNREYPDRISPIEITKSTSSAIEKTSNDNNTPKQPGEN